MFTTPKEAFTKLRAHPYLSPLKLFGFAETPTVTPFSSPGGHSAPFSSPPSSPANSRHSAKPPPRKRCDPYSLNRRPIRSSGKGYHRVGMRRTPSQQSLRMQRSIRNLAKAKAARDSKFGDLSRAAFHTASQARTLTSEERIFLTQLAKLDATHKRTTLLAEARAAADRAEELAPFINAEREAKAQASLECEKEQRRALAKQKEARAAAERDRWYQAKRRAEELLIRKQRLAEVHKQREQEEANDALRQQVERERLAHEQEARRQAEEVARLREEQEAFRRMDEEHTRLQQERLAQEQRDAQAFIDATLRFQEEARERLQREQAARLQAEQQAYAWFEAAQQAEMAAQHARAQWNSRGFGSADVSMKDVSMRSEMDTSMLFDMDASMRTAAPYSPPPSPPRSPSPPPPLSDTDRFVLYERKWAALKSDVPVLSFEFLPWPILHDVSTPEDITDERMAEFFRYPERPGYENKTQKERNRIELLRWHPDKFLARVLGKVDAGHRAMVKEAVGQVSRFLVAA